MSTAISLAGLGIDDTLADRFFDRIRELEDLLSRFRPHSQVSRIARGELALEDADPAVNEVVLRCELLRIRSGGAFDHEPRARSGDPSDPVLDVNAVAKGWIVQDAAAVLRAGAAEYIVNAGGDVVASPRVNGSPWRVAIQHPQVHDAIFGVIEIADGAVATSGTYERGRHLRTPGEDTFDSVTVTGPDLATADGLSTAAFVASTSPPSWWGDVPHGYGLLTLAVDGHWSWTPPPGTSAPTWRPSV